jgi:hypothetical protein
MTYYRRVEIVDGETEEPVNFVGVYTLHWPEGYTPEAAFVEEDSIDAKMKAAKVLAEAIASVPYGEMPVPFLREWAEELEINGQSNAARWVRDVASALAGWQEIGREPET